MNAVKEARPYEPSPVDRLWLHRCDPLTRRVAQAALNALPQVAAEHNRAEIIDSLKALEFAGSVALWGEDAVKRGRKGEALSNADWDVLAKCVKTRAEAEVREREAAREVTT